MELYWAFKVDATFAYLDEEESHHCLKVMRNKPGDQVRVTDGKGRQFTAVILNDDRNGCQLQIGELIESVSQKKAHCHIAIAPTKSIDRFEWFLEKATEIGVDEITPLICSRSERLQVKHARLQKQVVSAMKQSLRSWLPILNEQQKFTEFVKAQNNIDSEEHEKLPICKLICYCGEPELPLLKEIYQPNRSSVVLIGPEGDFTPEEITLAVNSGFKGAGLGDARLRTETAGVVAVHTIQLINGSQQ